jgi:hypothetical protein
MQNAAPEPSADLNAWAAFCASVRGVPCKRGTPHCCDAPLVWSRQPGKREALPLKLPVLPRHRQPGVTGKSTEASATLRLRLCSPLRPNGWRFGLPATAHALAEMQRERSRAASTMTRLLKVRLSESAEQRGAAKTKK